MKYLKIPTDLLSYDQVKLVVLQLIGNNAVILFRLIGSCSWQLITPVRHLCEIIAADWIHFELIKSDWFKKMGWFNLIGIVYLRLY